MMDFNKDIREDAEAFDRSLQATMKELDTAYNVCLHVSTMTLGVYLGENIDLQMFLRELDSPSTDLIKEFTTLFMQNIKRDTRKRDFNNSIILKIQGKTMKLQQAVKVFQNGSLHITGFKTVTEAIELSEVFSTFMELVSGGTGANNTYSIKSYEVQLINVCFQHPCVAANQKINLTSYHKNLSTYTSYYTSLDTDRYAGVVLKSPFFTIMTFESGSIIITAINTAEKLKEAFLLIYNFFKNCAVYFVVDSVQARPPSSFTILK